MKTTDQVFGKLQRQLDADAAMAAEELEQRERRAAEQEARLDAPLTRREALDALENVAREYGGNGDHDSDIIYNALRKLWEALS